MHPHSQLKYSNFNYPFGMVMLGRNDNTPEYRYGFNGMEKDDEVKDIKASHYDLGLRHYDARLGRMMSSDPRAPEYPWQSPYVYHRNSPINYIDYLGGGDPENDPDGSSSRTCTAGMYDIPNMINDALSNNVSNSDQNSSSANTTSGNSQAKLTITIGGVNTGKTSNTLNGPNNIDLDFTVTGGTDIQKIQVTQFVKVSNDDGRTENEANSEGAIVSENGKYLFFIDPGQNSISYYTPEEEEALKQKSWTSDETKKFYEINKDGTGGRLAFSDNGAMFNDPELAYNETYFMTYVSVVDSEGVRTVIGYIKWGFTKDSKGNINPTYTGTPKVFPATDFINLHKQLLILSKFL